MDILLCGASMGIGGAETHMLSLAEGLSDKGHRVTVAAERGELCEELKKREIRFVRVPLIGKDIGEMVRSYTELRRLLMRWNFDVVHAHSRLSALILYAVRQKEGLDFRFVVTAHARYKTGRALRLMSVWGDDCIAVSRDIKRHLVNNYGVEPNRIKVIPNGIDTERFHPIHGGDSHSVLFVSRLDRDCSMGAEAICAIAPELCRDFPDTRITVAGGGSELERIKQLAHKANLASGRKCISVKGNCTDVPKLMAEHECVVGVSRVALEAMAMGKTVVLFGNEGALGLLEEKSLSVAAKTNFTCRGNEKNTNKEYLLSELRRVFTLDKNSRKRLQKLGREVVTKGYSINKMTDMTLSVYNNGSTDSPKITVGGYYGFGNLGDESVLEAVSDELKRSLPDCRITALTNKGSPVGEIKGIDFVNRWDPIAVVRALRKSNVYISGGGSLLQNRTSMRSLAYYCGMLWLAGKMGNKRIILSNGIGPIHGRLAERMTRNSLLTADYVSVRDMDSFLKVLSITGGRVIPNLSADPVFIVPEKNTAKKEDRKKLLECGVRYAAVALNGDRKNTNQILCPAVGEYCRRHKLLPVFVSMDTKIDIKAAADGAKAARGIMIENLNLSGVYGILKNAEIAIGARLHFLIFSLCVGTPFIPISSDPKIDSFSLEALGTRALRINRCMRREEVLQKLERFASQYGESTDSFELLRAVEAFSARAKGDMRRVACICKGISEGKYAKALEKRQDICYN